MKDGSVAEWLSAAWPGGSERRFYVGHDRKINGFTPTQASMVRSIITCFMAIIPARRNLTRRKLKKSEAKFKRKNRKQGQLQASLDLSYA